MSEITVKKDGLYQNGKKLKLEFGNDEQLKVLKKHEKKVSDLRGQGLLLNLNHEISLCIDVRYKCLCGEHIHFDVDINEMTQPFEGIKSINPQKCRCGFTYKFGEDNSGDLLAFLVEDPEQLSILNEN
jgi:hypothetical protein